MSLVAGHSWWRLPHNTAKKYPGTYNAPTIGRAFRNLLQFAEPDQCWCTSRCSPDARVVCSFLPITDVDTACLSAATSQKSQSCYLTIKIIHDPSRSLLTDLQHVVIASFARPLPTPDLRDASKLAVHETVGDNMAPSAGPKALNWVQGRRIADLAVLCPSRGWSMPQIIGLQSAIFRVAWQHQPQRPVHQPTLSSRSKNLRRHRHHLCQLAQPCYVPKTEGSSEFRSDRPKAWLHPS